MQFALLLSDSRAVLKIKASLGICAAASPNHDKHKSVRVTKIYSFPLGTWIENLAVRYNGIILASSVSTAQIWQVNPTDTEATSVIATIPDHISLAGITEVQRDVFYVNANNFSLAEGLVAHPNTSAIYRVDLSQQTGSGTVEPSLVASFLPSGLLNGLTTFDADKGLVLAGDSGVGYVWRLNVFTGKKTIAASDPLMTVKDPAKGGIGINGLKLRGHWLYFTNSDRGILARIQLDAEGLAVGKAELLASYTAPDDMLPLEGFKRTGVLAAGNDEIRFVDKRGVHLVSNDPLLEGSTAIRTGSDSGWDGVFYVSTSGGTEQYIDGNVTNPGKIVRLDVGVGAG